MLEVTEQLAHKTGIPIEDTDFFFFYRYFKRAGE